jgi:hypothetical protein
MTILKTACLFVLSAAWAICFGQGSISGKILTAAGNGAAIPGAPVQATNLDTKETYKATSASDGSYNLSDLPAGAYEISVENVPRFLPFHQGNVAVAAGKATRFDIRLDDYSLNTLGSGGEQFVELLKEQPAPSGPTPRTGDGKPDLSGVWRAAAAKLAGDGPIGKQSRPRSDGGGAACLPQGISRPTPTEFQIVQTPTLIVILDGGWNPDRQIYLDGRGHPKDFNPSWMGHSIGHWEGDTLAVETTGFNALPYLVIGGGSYPQTETLRVTERFHRLDRGHLEVLTTYDDPSVFRKPFTTRRVHALAPKDWEILEYVCNENNRDLPHLKVEK